MQQYMELEIKNEILRSQNFIKLFEAAAQKDDNMISKQEQKIINKIEKLSNKYVAELEKIIRKE